MGKRARKSRRDQTVVRQKRQRSESPACASNPRLNACTPVVTAARTACTSGPLDDRDAWASFSEDLLDESFFQEPLFRAIPDEDFASFFLNTDYEEEPVVCFDPAIYARRSKLRKLVVGVTGFAALLFAVEIGTALASERPRLGTALSANASRVSPPQASSHVDQEPPVPTDEPDITVAVHINALEDEP